jgi:hypothetical protein
LFALRTAFPVATAYNWGDYEQPIRQTRSFLRLDLRLPHCVSNCDQLVWQIDLTFVPFADGEPAHHYNFDIVQLIRQSLKINVGRLARFES